MIKNSKVNTISYLEKYSRICIMSIIQIHDYFLRIFSMFTAQNKMLNIIIEATINNPLDSLANAALANPPS